MKSHTLHAAAERLARARNLSIREAHSILSKRGAAERRRNAQTKREPVQALRSAWWNRDLAEE